MVHKLSQYKNKKVIVMAGGIAYKGVLKEVTEEAINLRGLTGWIEIPIDKVTSVRLETDKEGFKDNNFVNPSYWEMPPEEK
jgi:hypothetical protein